MEREKGARRHWSQISKRLAGQTLVGLDSDQAHHRIFANRQG
jgi:hypothetical protein